MNCKSCKNYAPVKVDKKPVTTVKVWEPNIKGDGAFISYKYQFKGKPDIDRVIRETLDEGVLAVKVKCTKEFTPSTVGGKFSVKEFLLFKEVLSRCGFNGWYTRANHANYRFWNLVDEIDIKGHTDSDIEAAITKYLEKQKPAKDTVELLEGGGYRVTHELTPQEMRDCEVTISVPYIPEFHVGQIVVSNFGLGRIEKLPKRDIRVSIQSMPDGSTEYVFLKNCRPATPDEIDDFYTRELGGGKVRAYRNEIDNIFLKFEDDSYKNNNYMAALLEAAHIPIMPYSESGGNYKAPK